ncbi:MAG: hydrogenase maturation protease [Elusimicrobiota bacterium]|jgi:hydrogenase maturation protease
MNGALVIGYGNPLRTDDGLGWQAAACLAQACSESDVRILTCHQLTPELAETISQAERVAFIDASEGGSPGELVVEPVQASPTENTILDHAVNPSRLLAYARQLYHVSPPAVVFSIRCHSFELGEGLSPEVSAVLPVLVSRVQQWLRSPSGEFSHA